MKRIKLVGRDYGLSLGIDRAIRSLVEMRRLSGLAVVANSKLWQREALALGEIVAEFGPDLQVGLTICLCAPFSPMSERGQSAFGDYFPSYDVLRLRLATRLFDRQALEEEVALQVLRFTDHLGTPPNFINGWRNVHNLKPVRAAIYRFYTDNGDQFRPWLFAAAKSSRKTEKLRHRDRQSGFPQSPVCLSAPVTRNTQQIRQFFYTGVDFAPSDSVVSVRPAGSDEHLKMFDHRVLEREEVWRFLASSEFDDILFQKDLFVY